MLGKILTVVGNMLKNVHGWFDLPGKGVIYIYIFFFEGEMDRNQSNTNFCVCRLVAYSSTWKFCMYVGLGCSPLLPERNHLHVLAVHILTSIVRSNKNSCKELATT